MIDLSIRTFWPALASVPVSRDEPGTDDASLLRRAGKGDSEAFAELVAQWEAPARTYARRALGDADEAEDAVQDAFLQLWRTAPEWKPRAAPRAWFFTLLSRRCLDRLRRRKFAPVGEPSPQHPDAGALPRQTAEKGERAEMLAEAIEALPPRQRLAVLLFHTEELSLKEGAAAMDLKPKAFESLLIRARRALREELRQRGLEA